MKIPIAVLAAHALYAIHNTHLALQGIPIADSLIAQWGAVGALIFVLIWVIREGNTREDRLEKREDDRTKLLVDVLNSTLAQKQRLADKLEEILAQQKKG